MQLWEDEVPAGVSSPSLQDDKLSPSVENDKSSPITQDSSSHVATDGAADETSVPGDDVPVSDVRGIDTEGKSTCTVVDSNDQVDSCDVGNVEDGIEHATSETLEQECLISLDDNGPDADTDTTKHHRDADQCVNGIEHAASGSNVCADDGGPTADEDAAECQSDANQVVNAEGGTEQAADQECLISLGDSTDVSDTAADKQTAERPSDADQCVGEGEGDATENAASESVEQECLISLDDDADSSGPVVEEDATQLQMEGPEDDIEDATASDSQHPADPDNVASDDVNMHECSTEDI